MSKTIFYFFIYILCYSTQLPAQQLLWEKNRNIFNEPDPGFIMYRNIRWWNSENLIVFGEAQSRGGYYFDIYDLDGNLLKTIMGHPRGGGGGSIIRLENGDYIYGGHVFNIPFGNMLQYITSNGDTLSSKIYNLGTQADGGYFLVQSKDKKKVILGGLSANLNSNTYFSMLKTDLDLNQEWFRAYPSINIDSSKRNYTCLANHRGNYMMVGDLFRQKDGKRNPYLVEVNPQGDTVQTKWLPIQKKRNTRCNIFEFVQTAEHDYVFPIDIDTIYPTSPFTYSHTGLVKVDTNFNLVWKFIAIPPTQSSLEINSVYELSDSSYLFCAMSSFANTNDSLFFYKVSKYGKLQKRWGFKSKYASPLVANIFFPNDSSIVLTGTVYGDLGCYIARIGGVGHPMHPDPRPALYIAPPEPVYTIPNLITPNNDGLNETFEILSNKIQATGVQLKIYNRWGSQIYTSHNYQHNWAADGLGDGVYYYQVDVKDKKYKGWVQVVR